MKNLNIEKFSPQKAELVGLANRYKSLTINGIDDVAGYNMVGEARKDLKKKRVSIKNTGKEMRDEANKFAKAVIGLEKELVGIIEPLEIELKEKQEEVDIEKIKETRKIFLPKRKEKLEKVRTVEELTIFPMPSDNELLEMTEAIFESFLNEKKDEYFEEVDSRLIIKAKEIERREELEEARKKAKQEAEEQAKKDALQAKKEAKEREERIKKDAEKAKEKAVQEAKEKAEKKNQDLINAQEQKECKRKEEEERIKKEKEEKEKAEKEEAKELEGEKEYIKFLTENGYTEETKSQFHIERVDNQIILYKFVAKFNI